MNTTTKRYGSALYAGPYVDGRQGAVVLVGGQIVHLTPAQCLQLAEQLTAKADPPISLIADQIPHLTPEQCRLLAQELTACAHQTDPPRTSP